MQASRPFCALALAAMLGFGMAINVTPARAQSNSDQSSSAGAAVTDTWITTKVKGELATTEGAQSTDISVTTVDGVVTLTGVLPTEIAVKKAVAAAQSIDGVKHVDASGLKSKD